MAHNLKINHKLSILETNVDDCTPEVLSFLMEKVMEEGALDIHIVPCIMKKGRMGNLIRVLTDDPEKFAELLMHETGTLGVREIPIGHRYESEREIKKIKIKISGSTEEVAVKVSEYGAKPEFEDVKKIAKKYKLSYGEILDLIED